MPLKKTPDQSLLWSGVLLFGSLLSWLKLQQYWNFQNQAFDLGIYANVVWNTAHGRWFWDSIKELNYLQDHFSPGLAVMAPLMRAFPHPALLSVMQSFALALAIPAVFRLGGWMFVLLYVLNPLLHEASRYDVHAVTFAVPLLFWGLAAKNVWCFMAAATLQEDLWLCAAAASGNAYFLLGFLASFLFLGRPAHFNFYSPSNIAASLLSLDRVVGAVRLLVPLAGLPLLSRYWPLLVPLGYTWLGANPHQGRLDLHYGAPVLPFAFMAAASVKRPLPKWLLPLAAAACVPFLRPYYRANPKAATAAEMLSLIPPGAPAAASFNLLPHLALRERIKLWQGQDVPGHWLALDAQPFAFGGGPQDPNAMGRFISERAERVVFARDYLILLRPL